MTHSRSPRRSAIALILWISALGVTFLNFQPLILAEFVASGVLNESDAGFLASVNMFGMCLSLVAALLWMHRWVMSTVMLIALLLMGLGDLLTGLVASFELLAVVRLLAGTGEGLALAAAVSVVSGMFSQPGRMFAFIMVAMSVVGAIGLYVLPYVIAAFGITGAMAGIGLMSLMTIPFYRLLPTPPALPLERQTDNVLDLMSIPAMFLLASLLLVYASHTSVWVYYGRVGAFLNINDVDIGRALSASLIASMSGGLLAAWVGDRVGHLIPILFGITFVFAALAFLYLGDSYTFFTLSAIFGLFGIGIAAPYFLGVLALYDKTGRLPVVGKLTVYGGMFIGPAIGAVLIRPGNYDILLVTGMAGLGVSIIVALVALTNGSQVNLSLVQTTEA